MKTLLLPCLAALGFGCLTLAVGLLQGVYTPEVMQRIGSTKRTALAEPRMNETEWLTLVSLQTAQPPSFPDDVDSDEDLQSMSPSEKVTNAQNDRDVSRQAIETIQNVQDGAGTGNRTGDRIKARVNELLRDALSLYSTIDKSLQELDQAIKTNNVSEQLTQAKKIRQARERIKQLEDEALRVRDSEPLPPSRFGFFPIDDAVGVSRGAAAPGAGTGAGIGGGVGGGGGGGGGGVGGAGVGPLVAGFAAAVIGSSNNNRARRRLSSPFSPEPTLTPEQFGATGGGEMFAAGSGVVTN